MLRFAVVALISLLVVTSEAGAATLPKSKPPNAEKLRKAGVSVVWPVGIGKAISGGQPLKVLVISERMKVTVALERADSRNRITRTVARSTLRSGSFRTTVPKSAPGARYRLTLTAGKQRYWSWITTTRSCESSRFTGVPSSTMTPGSGHEGDTLRFALKSRGPGCIGIPATLEVEWERATAPGVWARVTLNCNGTAVVPEPEGCISLPAFQPLPPGLSHTFTRPVPNGLAAGTYRVTIALPSGYHAGGPAGALTHGFEVLGTT